jgi:Tol biopolymer transport system component
MKYRLFIVPLLIMLSACSASPAADTRFATADPTATSWLTFTPSPIPTITASPAATLTPAFPPYTGRPFSMVFLRGRNLWIAQIGEEITERQLTFEPEAMRIISFDVSPDETRIIYIPYQVEPLNSLVKVVDIATGDSKVVLGEDDPFSETNVVWLDDNRIAYINQQQMATSFITESVKNITTYIIYDLQAQQQLEVTDFIFLQPSPDRRFWLGCSGNPYVPCQHYTLIDNVNGRERKLNGSIKVAGFLGWSSDNRFMLFNTVTSPDICISSLILVSTETLQQTIISPEGESVWDASFSPTGNRLLYEQAQIADQGLCTGGRTDYWVMNLEHRQTYRIPIEFEKDVWDFTWSPDGQRLIFFHDAYSGWEHQLWSMKPDGSDLKPLLPQVEKFKILATHP